MLSTRSELTAAGLTRGVVAGPKFVRVVHGIHAPASEPMTVELRCDAVARVVPHAVFSHETAAELLGLPLLDAPPTLHITVPPPGRAPRHKGVQAHVSDFAPGDVVVWHGRRVTSAARTLLDMSADVSLRGLVVAGDVILRRSLASAAELEAMADAYAGRRGVTRARKVLTRLDAGSRSPRESLLRLRFEEEGLPRPVCNVPIFDELGCFVVEPDLTIEKAKIVVEYDSWLHLTARQQQRDARRDRLMIALGYIVLRATNNDLDPRAHGLFETIRQLVRERAPHLLADVPKRSRRRAA